MNNTNIDKKIQKKISKSFKQNKIYDEVGAILFIFNRHFWGNYLSPFFAFVFPIIFLVILGQMLGYQQLLGNPISIGPAAIGLISFPIAIFEFKNSILLKRIGITKITPIRFLGIIALYYALIMFMSSMITLLFSFLLYLNQFNVGKNLLTNDTKFLTLFVGLSVETNIKAASISEYFSKADWGGIFYGIFLSQLISLSMGMFISSFAKSVGVIQSVGIPILIISMFLTAQSMPTNIIAANSNIWYVGYITPLKSPSNIIINSLNNSPIENWNKQSDVDFSALSNFLNSENFKTELKNNYSYLGLTDDDIKKVIDALNGEYSWIRGNSKVAINEDFNQYYTKFINSFFEEVKKVVIQKEITRLTPLFSETEQNKIAKATEEITKSLSNNGLNFSFFENANQKIVVNQVIKLSNNISPFNVNQEYKTFTLTFNDELTVSNKIAKIFDLFITYIWSAVFVGVSLKLFKWSTR